MIIEFTGSTALNPSTFGISFQALVDDARVNCQVSTEALQDIEPAHATAEPMEQFERNRIKFQEMAKALILGGRVQNGQISISCADVSAYNRTA